MRSIVMLSVTIKSIGQRVIKLSAAMLNVIVLAYPLSEALIGTRLLYESGFRCKYLARHNLVSECR
jgi:hypothetical protein